MARVVVVGGGLVGLSTAMLLAHDDHEVTVLERDAQEPPADADAAWTGWARRGVNQFRMLHYLLPRFRAVVSAELPEVAAALDDAGALRLNNLALAPVELTGGLRPGDEQFEALTARRPVAEAVVARVAAATPNVEIRRGVAVKGFVPGGSPDGVPHVAGVRTEDGHELTADVVVDASGRRSSTPRLLTDIGARAPIEELDDCGFVYYGRYFRSADGSTPAIIAPLLSHYDSVSILTLPADNGTWGVGLVTSARDTAMRAVRDADVWTRTVEAFPLVAHWLDGEPIDDGVAVMAKIEDRHRDFVVDGVPVATGVLPVGDAWACTNPSVGRGLSIGLLHAVALRDLLRDASLDDARAVALRWHETTAATVEPWFRATLSFDRHRLAEIEAALAGVPYETDDPSWEMTQALAHAAMQDADVFRGFLGVVGLLALPDEVLAQPGMFDKVVSLGRGWRDAPVVGPTRDELVKLVEG